MRLNPYPQVELSPLWTTIVWAIATMWANWIWERWFTQADGLEIALLAMASLLGWPAVLAIAAGILTLAIGHLEDHFLVCAAIALCAVGVGLMIYDIPRPWNLVVSVVIAAVVGRKAVRMAQDESDLEDLSMAVKEIAPHDLLDRFSNPVWKRLELTALQALWMVRSQRRGHEWLVIELLQRRGERLDITTTVFMVKLPSKSARWSLPGNRITEKRQVCVDDEWVYVAALGQQPRVRDWPRWLDIAIDTADEVVRTASTHPVPGRHYRMEDGTQVPSPHPSWNPHDGNWVFLWTAISLLIGGFVLLFMVFGYQDWQRTGMITRGCDAQTHMGTVLTGWKAAAWFGILALPLLGICRLAHTLLTRAYKPAFALQINVEGIVVLAMTFGLAFVLEALERSARAAC